MPGAPPPGERTPLLSASTSERASVVETAPGSLGNGYGSPIGIANADGSEASSTSGQRTPRASELGPVPAVVVVESVGGSGGQQYGSVMVGSPSNADRVTEQ